MASVPQRHRVHKLIVPQPITTYLDRLVLCWKENGPPATQEIRNIAVSTDINNVDCVDCWELWRNARYQG